ncbi:MAG: esterase/lipase family protein [Pyrinomonadaceae bacterium]
MSNNKLPIVLAHGIARFDVLLEILKDKLKLPETRLAEHFHYFKGIKPHLEANGFTVFHPNQDFAGSVELRSGQLKLRVDEALAQTRAPRVHIIAHSMGGLDARHMIVDLGMADKVASLTTIGTPHRGTILADHLLSHGGALLRDVLQRVINVKGTTDLTIASCEQFNRRAEDQEARNDVAYQAYASSEDFRRVFAPLIPSWLFIRDHAGRNDGLVPFDSQQWTQELVASDGRRKPVVQKEFPFEADHLNQVGWWDPQEAAFGLKSLFKQAGDYEDGVKAVYLEIARSHS